MQAIAVVGFLAKLSKTKRLYAKSKTFYGLFRKAVKEHLNALPPFTEKFKKCHVSKPDGMRLRLPEAPNDDAKKTDA